MLYMAAGNTEARAFIHPFGAPIEISDVKDDAPPRESLVSEVEPELHESESEAPACEIRSQAKAEEDPVGTRFEIQRSDEATAVVANRKEPFGVPNWLTVVVVEVIGGLVSPTRDLLQRLCRCRFYAPRRNLHFAVSVSHQVSCTLSRPGEGGWPFRRG